MAYGNHCLGIWGLLRRLSVTLEESVAVLCQLFMFMKEGRAQEPRSCTARVLLSGGVSHVGHRTPSIPFERASKRAPSKRDPFSLNS